MFRYNETNIKLITGIQSVIWNKKPKTYYWELNELKILRCRSEELNTGGSNHSQWKIVSNNGDCKNKRNKTEKSSFFSMVVSIHAGCIVMLKDESGGRS